VLAIPSSQSQCSLDTLTNEDQASHSRIVSCGGFLD